MFDVFEILGTGIIFNVVINHEEQYSIWPAHLKPLSGWKAIGVKGSLDDCANYLIKAKNIKPILPELQKEMALKARKKLG